MTMTEAAEWKTAVRDGEIAERGSGPGLAVVLHAAGSSPRALDRFAAGLAPMAGKIRLPELTSGSASLVNGGPEPFTAAVRLAKSLLGGDDAGPRLLVGHSMGGLVALLALAQDANATAAVLYEPIVLSLLDPADAGDKAALDFVLSLLDPADAGDKAALDWDRDCIGRFRRHCEAGNAEAGVAGFIEAYGEHPWSALPASARADLVARAPSLLAEASATHAARLEPATLRGMRLPVLVIDGKRSPDVARRMARRLVSLLPNALHVTLDGTGHMGPVVAPKAVNAAIAEFLQGLGLASPA